MNLERAELPRQRLLPGLLGMAAATDRVYLRALHAWHPEAANRDTELNRTKAALYEIDFAEFTGNVRAKRWPEAERQISEAAVRLKAAGAEFLVITSNTGNTLTSEACADSGLPVLDIVRPTLEAVRAAGCVRAGIVGTVRTVESRIYQDAGRDFALEIIAPPAQILQPIQTTIFSELVLGKVTEGGLGAMLAAADWFSAQGAGALVLGCTDMTHMVERLAARTSLFVADTTLIHAAAAARAAWSGALA